MKFSVLLLLLLPLHSFAQYGRSYTGPTMQQNQQSRQSFNQMTNQRTQDFQQRQLLRNRAGAGSLSISRETRLQAHAKQQQREHEATEALARLAQQQQRQRQEHPAQTPQLAAAQLRADEKQLTLLAVKNYGEVFLPGQVATVLEAQQLSPSAQQTLQHLQENLLNDAWWSKQEGPQVAGKIKAYSDSLSALTTGLLGFDLASPPPMPPALSVRSLNERLTHDAFDPTAATQLLREAALTERLRAGDELVKAVQEFSTFATAVAASPTRAGDAKKLRKDVKKSLHTVTEEMERYTAVIAYSDKVYKAEKALRNATSAYVDKNSK